MIELSRQQRAALAAHAREALGHDAGIDLSEAVQVWQKQAKNGTGKQFAAAELLTCLELIEFNQSQEIGESERLEQDKLQLVVGQALDAAGILATYSPALQALIKQFSTNPAPATGATNPPLKSTIQDAHILEVIQRLGYKPESLPKNDQGISGVRKEVRDNVDKLIFPNYRPKIFDRAWERLSSRKEIKYT